MTVFMDIATDALRRLGVYATGETISDADFEQALITYNDMLDQLSNQNLASYANYEQSFTLVPNDRTYPIGPTGQIVQARPLQILTNPGSARIVDFQGNNYPMDVIDQFAWNQISTQVVTSDMPQLLFYDPQFPNGIINVWPTPSIAYTLYFVSRLALTDVSTLASSISLPPGYLMMLKTNLAQELLPYFPQDEKTTVLVVKKAAQALATVKRTNSKTPLAVFDSTLVKKPSSAPYNIFTDNR